MKKYRIGLGDQFLEFTLEDITVVVPEPEPEPEPLPQDPIASGLLSQSQLDVLKRIFAENHPLAQTVKSLADNDLAYNQQGEWATLVWLGTGDVAYAQKAFEQFRKRWVDPLKLPEARSDTREFLATIAQHYEWCEPGLTEDQAKEWRRILMLYAELCFGRGSISWGTRLNDDDEVVGHYLGLMKIALVLAKKEPEYSQLILNDPQMAAMRQEIIRFCNYAKGGEWVTADGYNTGTTKVAMIGLFSIGPETFPELLEYLKEASLQHSWDIFPGLKDSVKFGDTSIDKPMLNTGHIAYSAMFAGLMGNRNERCLYEILSKQQSWWIELYRVLWVIDPDDVPTESYVEPKGFRSTNVGLHICRDTDYMLQVYTPVDLTTTDGQRLDHTQNTAVDGRLLYKGNFVWERPIGYEPGSAAYNSVLFAGMGRFNPNNEVLEIVSAEKTNTGCKIVWRFKMVDAPWSTPPFVNNFIRVTEFFAPNKIVITDSFDGKAPDLTDAYWSDQWKQWQADIVRSAPALWQSIYHTPVEPTKTATGYEWVTQGGKKATLTTDARSIVLKTTLENVSPVGVRGTFDAGQLNGYQIRLLGDDPITVLKATLLFEE